MLELCRYLCVCVLSKTFSCQDIGKNNGKSSSHLSRWMTSYHHFHVTSSNWLSLPYFTHKPCPTLWLLKVKQPSNTLKLVYTRLAKWSWCHLVLLWICLMPSLSVMCYRQTADFVMNWSKLWFCVMLFVRLNGFRILRISFKSWMLWDLATIWVKLV